ncbi:alpha/beta hydrolase [Kineococcus rhizosphaerae]|uniref:Enterochelin esterase-like enzyme n=1 Tax=Kineococcus rhizosphaerae TaxID=559628 RepID=A0A2T0R574_9ACTN|nr:alpha/beta hydrolase-fold protein [Kineococcus rhizosphaerae]PRY15918.1 enterochelin esterase-like enzyme [Kineococcus rhizosphaerae]
MSLSSTTTQGVAIGVAALALVAVIVFWRGLARRGVLGLLARTASLVGVNATVLVAVFLVVNSQFGLYSSWSDLLGLEHATTTTTTTAAGGTTQGSTPVDDVHPRPLDGYDGRVVSVDVPGPASGTTGQVLVVLPKDYGKVKAPAGGYPVLEAFHGWPGTPQQWLDAMKVLPALDGAVADHQLAESIVVVPDLEIPAGRDTECVDGPAGEPQLETWLARDVPAYVESHWTTSRNADGWASIGLSMGGWCANEVTMLHPQQFGAAITFGGYARLNLGSWRPFAAGSPQAKRYDLVALAKTDPPAVKLWALASKSDGLAWPSTSALADAAHGPLQVTLVTQQQGGHRTSIWAGFVPQALQWLGANEEGFAPTA